MTEGVIPFLSYHGALFFTVALFFYSFVHKDIPLKLACAYSAAGYFLCYCLRLKIDEYTAFYSAFFLVDAVWAVALWKAGMSRIIFGVFLINLMALSLMPQILENHWFFHGLYDYIYLSLSVAFVASLTILPSKYPLFFQSPYDERDHDEDSLRFFSGELLTNLSNFIHASGLR